MTTALTEVLVANSAGALLLGGVAWCVGARGRHPAVAHALYLVALLELVTPPLWEISAVTIPAPRRELAAPAAERAVVPAPGPGPSLARPVATNVPVAATARPSVEDLLLLLWLGGSAALVGLIVRRATAFRAAVRDTGPAPAEWQREALALLPAVGLRNLPVLDVTRADLSPLVYPTWRGVRILLPEPLLRRIPAVQRRSLILHELAHVRRRDPWVRLLEVAIVTALWWHPLAWWLRAGLRDAEEKACDAWVTAALPGGRRAYADAVLAVAEGLDGTTSPIPAHATGAVRLRSWKKRLRYIMSDDVHAKMSWRAKLGLLAIAAAVLPLMPTVAQQERSAGATGDADLGELLRSLETRQVQLRFSKAPLDDWIATLSGATGVRVEVTDAARERVADRTGQADVDLPAMPARKALDVVANILDVTWTVSPDNRVVLDAPKPAVRVIGEVRRPGWIEQPGGRDSDTVLEILSEVGTTEKADLGRVQLIRPDPDHPLVMEIDIGEMVRTGNTAHNVQLRAGDILVVPARRAPSKPQYLTMGDAVVFFIEPSVIEQPGFELLKVLTEPQALGIDGTILVPYVGRLTALGLTEAELEKLVSAKLQEVYQIKFPIYARFSQIPAQIPAWVETGHPK